MIEKIEDMSYEKKKYKITFFQVYLLRFLKIIHYFNWKKWADTLFNLKIKMQNTCKVVRACLQ